MILPVPRNSPAQTHELCLRSGCSGGSSLRGAGEPGVRAPRGRASRRGAGVRRAGQEGLIRIYGELHPFTLAANINYASDLAACGRLGEAIQIGQETLDKCRRSLGDNHPDTLIAEANLSVDEAAAGNQADAEQRLADVLRRYEETLTLEHPEARAAAKWTRLTAEIEPYDL